MKLKLTINQVERAYTVTQSRDRLVVEHDGDERVVEIVARSGPYVVVRYVDAGGNARLLRFAGHKDGAARSLWVDGQRLTYERVQPQRAAAPAGAAPPQLAASIPAVVSEVLVQTGDSVAEGDKLILLESMKMIIPIQAPFAGTVGSVHCRAGDAVQPGVNLVEIVASE